LEIQSKIEKEEYLLMKRKRGFTLVELLVVIAVIALLMSILMPVLKMARDQAIRIVCGNHVKNLMLSLTMYADKNSYKIPQGGGNWPWDVSWDVTYEMLKYMGTDVFSIDVPAGSPSKYLPIEFSTNFYCPANTQQRRWRDAYWEYTKTYRVLGYAFLWKAPWNNSGATPIIGFGPDGLQADPYKKWVDRTDISKASDTELIVDATLSKQVNDPRYPKGNFGTIATGSNPGGGATANCSNHLISDAKASGGNIGFADNHVEWRPFSEMKHRFTTTSSGDNVPIFWWW
jgi:prepilin-type N-terminal cleavage/methylation domain-containing protein/prepilin-type processing-associated H-X9-DG protein